MLSTILFFHMSNDHLETRKFHLIPFLYPYHERWSVQLDLVTKEEIEIIILIFPKVEVLSGFLTKF